jgi:hypothetical protein
MLPPGKFCDPRASVPTEREGASADVWLDDRPAQTFGSGRSGPWTRNELAAVKEPQRTKRTMD